LLKIIEKDKKTANNVKVTLKGTDVFESISGRRLPTVPKVKRIKASVSPILELARRIVDEIPETVAPTTI
jgi:hypothetical protein